MVASKETDELMVNIKQKSEEADKERAVVEVESAKCSKIADEVWDIGEHACLRALTVCDVCCL